MDGRDAHKRRKQTKESIENIRKAKCEYIKTLNIKDLSKFYAQQENQLKQIQVKNSFFYYI